jgi:hypothetical protein
MEYLKIFFIIYGVFILVGMFLQFPFLYNNMKSKFMIEKMGTRWFNILLLGMAIIFLALGILL